jgi:hypothetical protein
MFMCLGGDVRPSILLRRGTNVGKGMAVCGCNGVSDGVMMAQSSLEAGSPLSRGCWREEANMSAPGDNRNIGLRPSHIRKNLDKKSLPRLPGWAALDFLGCCAVSHAGFWGLVCLRPRDDHTRAHSSFLDSGIGDC